MSKSSWLHPTPDHPSSQDDLAAARMISSWLGHHPGLGGGMYMVLKPDASDDGGKNESCVAAYASICQRMLAYDSIC